MQTRPHIDKMLTEGQRAFDEFKRTGDRHALGRYQGIRRCLQFIHLLDADVNSKEDAGIAFRELSTYRDEIAEVEVPEVRESFKV